MTRHDATYRVPAVVSHQVMNPSQDAAVVNHVLAAEPPVRGDGQGQRERLEDTREKERDSWQTEDRARFAEDPSPS